MSGAADFLTKQVGPLPMGAWLLVGAGGLFIASRRDRAPQLVTDVREVPVPVGAIASPDGAPVVITPIFRVPELAPPSVVVIDKTTTVTPPAVSVRPPAPSPVVSPPAPRPSPWKRNRNAPLRPKAPAPAPKPAVPVAAPKPKAAAPAARTYTVRSGDTLSAIGRRYGIPWRTIYNANAAKLEGIARSKGRTNGTNGPSGVGHWIYPGTVLTIPAGA